jgi:hypothetical protein
MTLVTYHTGCKQSLLATGCSLRSLAVLAHRHIVLAVLAVAASILAVLAVAAGHILAIGHFIPSLAIFYFVPARAKRRQASSACWRAGCATKCPCPPGMARKILDAAALRPALDLRTHFTDS